MPQPCALPTGGRLCVGVIKEELEMKNIILALFFGIPSAIVSAQTDQPIKIAGSFDLSGANADVGRESLVGAQYAVEVVNGKGGVLGRQVVLDHQDNGTNPQRAVSQAAASVQEGAVLLLSPQTSGNVLAVSKAVSARLKVPMCVNGAASDDITIKEFQPYMFSVAPTLYMDFRALAARLAKQPYKRYAVIAPDNAGGRNGVNRFKAFMKEFNPQAQFVVEEYAKLGVADYTATINKVVAAQPDYVFSILYSLNLMTFTRQAQAVGFFKQINNKFIALYDGTTLKALGESAAVGTDGYQQAAFNHLLKSSPDARAFVTQFKAKTGNYPSDWTIMSYDCVMAWAQAANAAKSTGAEAIIRAVESNQFNLARGTVGFAKYDHEAEVPVYVGKVAQSGEFGQPILDIDEVVPAHVTHPSEASVQKMRHAD